LSPKHKERKEKKQHHHQIIYNFYYHKRKEKTSAHTHTSRSSDMLFIYKYKKIIKVMSSQMILAPVSKTLVHRQNIEFVTHKNKNSIFLQCKIKKMT